MTQEDKKVFIAEVCDNIKQDLLSKVAMMPENWNGIELRELLYEKFKDARHGLLTQRNKRAKIYKNFIMTHNF